MSAHYYEAKVILPPHHHFPFDMLRYDQCWPASETDSGQITQSVGIAQSTAERTICVRTVRAGRLLPSKEVWTVARWQSFGVKVVPYNT